MCQLLGMNCAAPTDFTFSLKGFCQRGGATDKHAHGWGAAIYEGPGVRCFHDTEPACRSPLAKLVQQYPIRTHNMMAHIRYATEGAVTLENVHPFCRELWGIQWTFCHNGECPAFAPSKNDKPILLGKTTLDDLVYRPIGDTDSEAVFCAMLNALRAEFTDGNLPTMPVLHAFIQQLCNDIVKHNGHPDNTIYNFLLGCGPHTLFAYSWPGARPGSKVWNGLHYIVRQPPFCTATLLDVNYTIDFGAVTTPADRVAVITTKPLTLEDGWTEIPRNQLILFDQGIPYTTPQSCEQVELNGHGLKSTAYFPRTGRAVEAAVPEKPLPKSLQHHVTSTTRSLSYASYSSSSVSSDEGSEQLVVADVVDAAAVNEENGVSVLNAKSLSLLEESLNKMTMA